MSSAPGPLDQLRSLSAQTGRRQRIERALRRAGPWTLLPAGFCALAVIVGRLNRAPDPTITEWLAIGAAALAAVPVALALVELFRRQPKYAGAQALDRAHGLDDRIATALSFSDIPAERRTGLMRLAIEDALAFAGAADPKKAAPFRTPTQIWFAAGLAVLAAGLWFVRVPADAPPPVVAKPHERLITADDSAALQAAIEELRAEVEDPQLLASAAELNVLIEQLVSQELDDKEAFRQLDALERELGPDLAMEEEALEQALQETAQALKASKLTKEAADSLAARKLPDAAEKLRELSKKLNAAAPESDREKRSREALKKALEKASGQRDAALRRLEGQRQELLAQQKRLLNRKAKAAVGEQSQIQSSLDQTRRKLERLSRDLGRDIERAKAAQRQMSELDRQLAEAARALSKELGGDDRALRNAGDEMDRVGQQRLTQQQKRELLRRVNEIRERLREGGPEARQHQRRLMRFQDDARGGKRGGQPKPGGQPGSGQDPDAGIGDAGIRLIPSAENVPGESGEGPGGGMEAGDQHDPKGRGERTDLPKPGEDINVLGHEAGDGPAESVVIAGAAHEGFVTGDYEKLYRAYRTVAEEVITQDGIPPGYRLYVRRYFELIRPRSDAQSGGGTDDGND